MMKVYAVLGDPISHSKSPAMHNAAFGALGMPCTYHAFRVRPSDLKDAIYGAKALGFGGLNLTIPLKEDALKYVEPDPIAARIGAVNTIDFADGITGHNTDGIGAMHALEDAGVPVAGRNILIIGAGGAARAIAFQFGYSGGDIVIANRTKERADRLARDVRGGLSELGKTPSIESIGLGAIPEKIADADILINATSIGMHPNIDATPVPAGLLRPGLAVFDIVYNPRRTRLLLEAEQKGATIVEGVRMLVHQGAEAFLIWTGREPPVDVMVEAVVRELR
ncbi:MAG TPA: shikimate dehydrogenase [Methanosarcinales archaeon]|nr:MAG: shikimate dehydrogenase [Methanosarcinales archaeon]HDN65569.1 shikimate dehydrogenase [Methanosarcinales archaeon]